MLRSAGFIAVALLFVFVSCDPVETVRAAGATFPEDVYNTWSSAYFAENPDVNIEYESTGSGTGKERIVEGSDVVFVGSDSLLSEEQYNEVPDLQVISYRCLVLYFLTNVKMMPFLAGGIVAFSKSFERLTFSRDLIVDIFLGKVGCHYYCIRILLINEL